MAAKVEAFIDFNGDFSKVEQKWDKFFKSIENKDIFSKQTFNRYTSDYVRTMDDAFNKMYKKRTELENRIAAYVKQRMKMGKYGTFDSPEAKAAFLQKRTNDLMSVAWRRYTSQYQKDLEDKQKADEKAKKDAFFKSMGALTPEEYDKFKAQHDETEKTRQKLIKQAQKQEKEILQDIQKTQKGIDENIEIRENLRQKAEKDFQQKSAQYNLAKIAWEKKQEKEKLKQEEIERKKAERDRKRFYNALFMKWGKLGIAGLIAGQAIKYITRGATAINQVAQTSLGHQMTIEGGASEGGFFGGSLAAMQRAGISAKEYGSWKRNMMGQVGSIKLGMGNAAPFMALGVSALDRMDDIELEIEKRLQRLPAETSWALGSQMGMSYELWERMYKGEIDRSKPGYDEDAIKAWAEAAKNINAVLTDIKVFFYNTLGPLARLLTTKEGIADVATAGMGVGSFLPGGIGYNLGRKLEFGITVKKDGNVSVDTSNLEAQNVDTYVQFS